MAAWWWLVVAPVAGLAVGFGLGWGAAVLVRLYSRFLRGR